MKVSGFAARLFTTRYIWEAWLSKTQFQPDWNSRYMLVVCSIVLQENRLQHIVAHVERSFPVLKSFAQNWATLRRSSAKWYLAQRLKSIVRCKTHHTNQDNQTWCCWMTTLQALKQLNTKGKIMTAMKCTCLLTASPEAWWICWLLWQTCRLCIAQTHEIPLIIGGLSSQYFVVDTQRWTCRIPIVVGFSGSSHTAFKRRRPRWKRAKSGSSQSSSWKSPRVWFGVVEINLRTGAATFYFALILLVRNMGRNWRDAITLSFFFRCCFLRVCVCVSLSLSISLSRSCREPRRHAVITNSNGLRALKELKYAQMTAEDIDVIQARLLE